MGEFERWISVIRDLGFPGVLLLFVCFALWKSGRWTGNQVILPLRNRFILFLGVLEKTQKQQAEALMNLGLAFKSHDEWERTTIEERDKVIVGLQSKMGILEERIFSIENK